MADICGVGTGVYTLAAYALLGVPGLIYGGVWWDNRRPYWSLDGRSFEGVVVVVPSVCMSGVRSRDDRE